MIRLSVHLGAEGSINPVDGIAYLINGILCVLGFTR